MEDKRGAVTCQIRYTLNPLEREAFTAYAQLWVGLVERYGGTHLGYYIPCDAPSGTQISFPGLGHEGPRDVAIALFTFPDEKSYLAYRAMAAVDPECSKAEAIVRDTACFTSYERLFLEPLRSVSADGRTLMPESEEKLTGGNTAESVFRVGNTVRKPVTKATAAVHSFLRHLHVSGFVSAPKAFGIDEQGRQVLEFVPGHLWNDRPRSRDDLHRVGAMIRALHDAAASFTPPDGAEWDAHSKPNGNQLVCHNDLAPWNLVCAPERWAFIDWDASAPSTPLWDLAWSAISFPVFVPECNLEDVTPAMHALLDGYGLEPERYEELIGLMVTRARDECGLILEGAKAGQQPWERLHREEHHLYWGPVADWIERKSSEIRDMLLSLQEAERQCS